MRWHSRLLGVVAVILASLAVWGDRTSHATLSVETTAQIDPLRMMSTARHLPTLRWTDYSLVFTN